MNYKDMGFCLGVCAAYGLDSKKVYPKDYDLLRVLNLADIFGEIPEDQETQNQIDEFLTRASER